MFRRKLTLPQWLKTNKIILNGVIAETLHLMLGPKITVNTRKQKKGLVFDL